MQRSDQFIKVQESRRVIRAFIRQRFDDERLAQVQAFNADGGMRYANPCRCLLGVTCAESLHRIFCTASHYSAARSLTFEYDGRVYDATVAEGAYCQLGISFGLEERLEFSSDIIIDTRCEELRRLRFNTILRAEMRQRDRIRERERTLIAAAV